MKVHGKYSILAAVILVTCAALIFCVAAFYFPVGQGLDKFGSGEVEYAIYRNGKCTAKGLVQKQLLPAVKSSVSKFGRWNLSINDYAKTNGVYLLDARESIFIFDSGLALATSPDFPLWSQRSVSVSDENRKTILEILSKTPEKVE